MKVNKKPKATPKKGDILETVEWEDVDDLCPDLNFFYTPKVGKKLASKFTIRNRSID